MKDKIAENKFLELYRRIFTKETPSTGADRPKVEMRSQDEVGSIIRKIQWAARQYSVEHGPNVKQRTLDDNHLDQVVNETCHMSMTFQATERDALVKLLVSDHDLQALKPWPSDSERVDLW